MNSKPVNVSLYLPTGNPNSIKVAEISQRTVLAISVPRNELLLALKRQDVSGYGVFLLVNENAENPTVYHGHNENCADALEEISTQKSTEWTHALILTNKEPVFSKSRAEYIQSLACEAIRQSKYALINPTPQLLIKPSEQLTAELEDYFDSYCILAGSLGYSIFDSCFALN